MRTIAVLLLLIGPAFAQTRPVATRPSVEQLHAAAYQFMRAGQYPKASAPLEQAYRAKPLADHTRALVLNHAMLDLMQKVNAMRAAKDLRDYLALHSEPDEQAINLLGAALQAAGKTPRVTQGDLYKSATVQLQQAVESLERTRPGQRKWGNKWYSDAEFFAVREQLEDATNRYRSEQDRADRLKGDWQAAAAEAQRYNTLNTNVHHRHVDPTDSYYCQTCIANRRTEQRREAIFREANETEARYKAQQQIADRARELIPKPDWTMNFVPIDPDAPPPSSILAP